MAELRRIGDLGQGLFRFRGGAFKHFFAVKLHSICRAAQQLGTQLADLFPQLHGTLLSGLAGNVGGTGCIGTGVIGRGIGVGTKYRNVVQRAVQHFGGDLRQRGVTAGAHIRCTDDQRVESIIVQLEGRKYRSPAWPCPCRRRAPCRCPDHGPGICAPSRSSPAP